MARVERLGQWALEYLRSAIGTHPLIRDIRGKGLFIGVEVAPELGAKPLVLALKERGVLSKDTHEVVIRLAPPLVIKKKHLKEALDALIDVVRQQG
jgi:ornithine--oxo-acid transaminase